MCEESDIEYITRLNDRSCKLLFNILTIIFLFKVFKTNFDCKPILIFLNNGMNKKTHPFGIANQLNKNDSRFKPEILIFRKNGRS